MTSHGSRPIPRRELVTLAAYLEFGSHKAAAHRLGISTSTSRQRVSQIIKALGVHNALQAAWVLRAELERERLERVRASARTPDNSDRTSLQRGDLAMAVTPELAQTARKVGAR